MHYSKGFIKQMEVYKENAIVRNRGLNRSLWLMALGLSLCLVMTVTHFLIGGYFLIFSATFAGFFVVGVKLVFDIISCKKSNIKLLVELEDKISVERQHEDQS